MASGLIRRAMYGLAEGLQQAGELGMRYALAAELKKLDEQLQSARLERLEELRGGREKELATHQHNLKTQDRRSIGEAMTAAGQPVTEQTDEVDYPVTRTPLRTDMLSAGERRAMELGDFESAKRLREMGTPKTTKVGENESIINERGEVVFRNTAGAERRREERETAHELSLEKLDYEYSLRRDLEAYKKKNGSESTTAMIRNIEFLTKEGIADSPAKAFEMLRTAMSKGDDDAAFQLAGKLMDSPGYRGKGGAAKALEDAYGLVENFRGGRSRGGDGGSGGYGSAEDVRSAFRAGKINRPTALRELKRFGLQ